MNPGLPNMWPQVLHAYDEGEPNLPIEALIADDFLSPNGNEHYTSFRPYTNYNTQRSTESHNKALPLLTLGEQSMNSPYQFEVDQSSPSSFGSSPYSALSQNRDFFPPANAGEQGQWATSEVAVASSTVGIDMHTSFSPASAYFGEDDSQFASQYIPENIPRHSDIMADDKRSLLYLMGIFISNDLDSTEVSRQFTQELCDSLTNSIHPGMNMQSRMGRLWGRPTKANVSSEAGKVASENRRKVPANFFCELRGVCGASFTRKNGLINHYKAHLGITDKQCRFCGQAFTTSVGRHEKKCKQNPENYEQKQTLPMLMAPGPMH